jgi:hypothetical protein
VKRADNTPGTVRFYSSAAYDPGGPVIEQAIVWNAFPKELLRRYGRERALVEANKLWPLRRYSEDLRPGSPACSDFTDPKTSQRSANRLDFHSLGASQRVFNVDSEINTPCSQSRYG